MLHSVCVSIELPTYQEKDDNIRLKDIKLKKIIDLITFLLLSREQPLLMTNYEQLT